MIRKASERIIEKPQRKFGAPGFITVRQLINDPAELFGKGRVFAHTTVLPGSGIGYHISTEHFDNGGTTGTYHIGT